MDASNQRVSVFCTVCGRIPQADEEDIHKTGRFWRGLEGLGGSSFPHHGRRRLTAAGLTAVPDLDNPQVAFTVKHRHTTMVETSVSITLELESYLLPKQRVARVEETHVDYAEIKHDALLQTMSIILNHLNCLETPVARMSN